jgi:hypothetical protein
MSHEAQTQETRVQNPIEPWNLSAVPEVASVSPDWTPTFIENVIGADSR